MEKKYNYWKGIRWFLGTVGVGTVLFLTCSNRTQTEKPQKPNLETKVIQTADVNEINKTIGVNDVNKTSDEKKPVDKVEQKEKISYTANLSAKEKLYFPIIYRESNKRNLDSYLILAQVKKESGFNSNAHSPAGAIGLSQIMPKTAESLGYSPREMLDPEKSIEAQTKLMRQNYEKFSSENFNDTEKSKLSLASYNAGYGHIKNSIKMVRAAKRGEKTYEVIKYKDKKKIKKIVNIESLKDCNETWDDGFSKALKLINPKDSGQTIDYVSDTMNFYNKYKN